MVEVFYGAIEPLFAVCEEWYVCMWAHMYLYVCITDSLETISKCLHYKLRDLVVIFKMSWNFPGPRRYIVSYFQDASDGAIHIFFAREMLFGSSPLRSRADSPDLPSRDIHDSRKFRRFEGGETRGFKEIEFLFTVALVKDRKRYKKNKIVIIYLLKSINYLISKRIQDNIFLSNRV